MGVDFLDRRVLAKRVVDGRKPASGHEYPMCQDVASGHPKGRSAAKEPRSGLTRGSVLTPVPTSCGSGHPLFAIYARIYAADNKRLLAATGNHLIDTRNRALLALAYDTLLRRSELVAVEVSDIVVEVDGSATILVRRSKTDPEGDGAQVYVAPGTVRLVREWLERSGVTERRVFRSLSRGHIGELLGPNEVPRIFKRMAEQSRIAARARRAHLRTQHARGGRARHGRRGDLDGSDFERRTLADRGDGEPIRGTDAGATQRGGTACPAAAARIG